jgi:DNA-binding response OmpR family regulator
MSRILVVDDDRHVSRTVGWYLVRAGYQVETETDGAIALDRVFALPPDLLVIEVTLPGMPGLDICRRIRSVSQIPVVMLSARTDEEARVAGFEAGADDYITKPFSPRELDRGQARTQRPVEDPRRGPTHGWLSAGGVMDNSLHVPRAGDRGICR